MSDVNTDNKEQNTNQESEEVTGLKAQLQKAQEQINKYDGERKDYSEQKNVINSLKEQVETLQQKVQQADEEDSKHEIVTKAELREFKEKENERFKEFTELEAQKQIEKEAEYQKHLAQASLSVKDEALFDEICKEHDYLVANGGMPESTGDPRADAQIAWRESENSLYRKKLASGQKVDFQSKDDVTTKPVVPGQKELSSSTVTEQKTTMPENLPDDAKEFVAMMGMGADSVNKALGK